MSWIFTLVGRHPWKFFSVEELSRFVNNLLCSDKDPECWVLPIKNWIEAIYRWLITPVEIMTLADLKSQQIICLEEFGDLYGHRNISCHFAVVSATPLPTPSFDRPVALFEVVFTKKKIKWWKQFHNSHTWEKQHKKLRWLILG